MLDLVWKIMSRVRCLLLTAHNATEGMYTAAIWCYFW